MSIHIWNIKIVRDHKGSFLSISNCKFNWDGIFPYTPFGLVNLSTASEFKSRIDSCIDILRMITLSKRNSIPHPPCRKSSHKMAKIWTILSRQLYQKIDFQKPFYCNEWISNFSSDLITKLLSISYTIFLKAKRENKFCLPLESPCSPRTHPWQLNAWTPSLSPMR